MKPAPPGRLPIRRRPIVRSLRRLVQLGPNGPWVPFPIQPVLRDRPEA